MAKKVESNFHGMKLRDELRRLREARGLSQEEAGEKYHYTVQKVSRVENGQIPGYHDLNAILRVYCATPTEIENCLELRELAVQRGWWRDYGIPDGTTISLEHVANSIIEFQIGHVPALLQTDAYGRKLAAILNAHATESELDATVQILRQRRDRLYDEKNPLTLHALIYEPVLYHTMDASQLMHMAELSNLPNVTVQIVPSSIGLHRGFLGTSGIFDFPFLDHPGYAYMSTITGESIETNPDKVMEIRTVLHDIVSWAHTPEQTNHMLRELASATATADHD